MRTKVAIAVYVVVVALFVMFMAKGGITPSTKGIIAFSFLEAHVVAILVYVCYKAPNAPTPLPTPQHTFPAPRPVRKPHLLDSAHSGMLSIAQRSSAFRPRSLSGGGRGSPFQRFTPPPRPSSAGHGISPQAQRAQQQMLSAFGKTTIELQMLSTFAVPPDMNIKVAQLTESFMRGVCRQGEVYALKFRRKGGHDIYTLTFYQQPGNPEWFVKGDIIEIFQLPPSNQFTGDQHNQEPSHFVQLRGLIGKTHHIFELA